MVYVQEYNIITTYPWGKYVAPNPGNCWPATCWERGTSQISGEVRMGLQNWHVSGIMTTACHLAGSKVGTNRTRVRSDFVIVHVYRPTHLGTGTRTRVHLVHHDWLTPPGDERLSSNSRPEPDLGLRFITRSTSIALSMLEFTFFEYPTPTLFGISGTTSVLILF